MHFITGFCYGTKSSSVDAADKMTMTSRPPGPRMGSQYPAQEPADTSEQPENESEVCFPSFPRVGRGRESGRARLCFVSSYTGYIPEVWKKGK